MYNTPSLWLNLSSCKLWPLTFARNSCRGPTSCWTTWWMNCSQVSFSCWSTSFLESRKVSVTWGVPSRTNCSSALELFMANSRDLAISSSRAASTKAEGMEERWSFIIMQSWRADMRLTFNFTEVESSFSYCKVHLEGCNLLSENEQMLDEKKMAVQCTLFRREMQENSSMPSPLQQYNNKCTRGLTFFCLMMSLACTNEWIHMERISCDSPWNVDFWMGKAHKVEYMNIWDWSTWEPSVPQIYM